MLGGQVLAEGGGNGRQEMPQAYSTHSLNDHDDDHMVIADHDNDHDSEDYDDDDHDGDGDGDNGYEI